MAKNIQSACLNQTIHFKLNEEVGRSLAVRKVKEEYELYKQQLGRSRLRYKIINEETQNDGSIVVKVKKQINTYDVGDYLDLN
jgi:hypothetical protein